MREQSKMDSREEETHELLDAQSREEQQEPLHPLALNPTPLADRPTAFLDGLRGLAALGVLIQHYVGRFDGNVHEHGFGENGNWFFASLPVLRLVLTGGNPAVPIFFVLSGYVLSRSPLTRLRDGKRDTCIKGLISATIRRPFRLYIPVMVITFCISILMHAPWGLAPAMVYAQPMDNVFVEVGSWFVEFVKYFNPFQVHTNLVFFKYSLVAWTIPIELKGSILVYALTGCIALVDLPHAATIALLSLSTAILLQVGKWTMACFIAGLLLSYIDVNSMDKPLLGLTARAQSRVQHAILITALYLISQPAYSGLPSFSSDTPGWHYLSSLIPVAYTAPEYYRYWTSWGALFFIYATLRLPWLQRFLNTRPPQYLGRVSFMLYLVHIPIVMNYGDRVGKMFGLGYLNTLPGESWWNNRLPVPDIGPRGFSLRFLLSLTLVLPVCLKVAEWATKLLDEPSVRMGKKLTKRLGVERETK